jgi:hypothetical protein
MVPAPITPTFLISSKEAIAAYLLVELGIATAVKRKG